MPYIEDSIKRDKLFYAEDGEFPTTCGELNYLLTRIIHEYIKENNLHYSTLNEVIGVLECVKAELLRTVVGPYEDKKRMENGPVSELDDDSRERMR